MKKCRVYFVSNLDGQVRAVVGASSQAEAARAFCISSNVFRVGEAGLLPETSPAWGMIQEAGPGVVYYQSLLDYTGGKSNWFRDRNAALRRPLSELWIVGRYGGGGGDATGLVAESIGGVGRRNPQERTSASVQMAAEVMLQLAEVMLNKLDKPNILNAQWKLTYELLADVVLKFEDICALAWPNDKEYQERIEQRKKESR